jgi:integrase
MGEKRNPSGTAGVSRRTRQGRDTYEARWRGRDSRTGEVRRYAKTFRTRKEAEAHLIAVKDQVRTGRFVRPEDARRTWGEVSVAWHTAKARKVKPQTAHGYGRVLVTWLARWDTIPIGDLSTDHVDALLADMDAAGKATQTQHNVYTVAQSVFDYAMKRQLIHANPCRALREELPSRAQRTFKPRFLAAAEVNALARSLPPPHDLLVVFAAWSGLRWAEIAGLRVRALDLLRASVRVEETYDERFGSGTPKSTRSVRTVPIPPTLARRLGDHISSHGLTPEAYLFRDQEGRPLRRSNWYARIYQPATRRADLPGLRFHDLRHTFASLKAAQGYSAREVSAWMGHGSVSFTLDTYTHLFPVDDDWRDRLDADFLAAEEAVRVSTVPDMSAARLARRA